MHGVEEGVVFVVVVDDSERIAPASAYVCCGCGGWKCEGTPPGLAAYQRSDIVVV